MEIWDLYDKNQQYTGETILRGEPIPEGRYHLVAHICIFNKAGQMLIQHRQSFKSAWPNKWDLSACGSALSGETIQMAAEREVWEELGYSLKLKDVPIALSITFPDGFDQFYIVEREIDPATLHLQYEEVQAVKWATKEEILTMISDNRFIPYHPSFIEYLFFRHDHFGTWFC